jgi:hippurate hydrolase
LSELGFFVGGHRNCHVGYVLFLDQSIPPAPTKPVGDQAGSADPSRLCGLKQCAFTDEQRLALNSQPIWYGVVEIDPGLVHTSLGKSKSTIMNKKTIITMLLLWTGSVLGASAASQAQRDAVQSQIERQYADLENLYRHLHSHPELSLLEEQTGLRLGSELANAGYSVTQNVGGHGVVAVLKNGTGPIILLRTDLDALPVKEDTGAAYASSVKTADDKGVEVPVMHACGHDVHITTLVGTARVLAALKDQWRGTLVLIGQPAEERGRGARAMLAEGLFNRFPKPDYCLALHVSARLPAGTVGYVEGYAMANVDALNLTIRGVGGHGAWPQSTKDPIVLAAETILALQTIVSRETPPGEAAVVTVGSIHDGTKHNIIPDQVDLQLTLRSFTDETRQRSLKSVERIAQGLAQAAGVPEDRMPVITHEEEFTPALFNTPELTRRLVDSLKPWLGPENLRQEQPVMGGEDFSEYGRTPDKIPITMLWLGAVNPDKINESRRTGRALPSLHSSQFLPLFEPTVSTGIRTLAASVFELAPAR